MLLAIGNRSVQWIFVDLDSTLIGIHYNPVVTRHCAKNAAYIQRQPARMRITHADLDAREMLLDERKNVVGVVPVELNARLHIRASRPTAPWCYWCVLDRALGGAPKFGWLEQGAAGGSSPDYSATCTRAGSATAPCMAHE
jgi:hypothetical protein